MTHRRLSLILRLIRLKIRDQKVANSIVQGDKGACGLSESEANWHRGEHFPARAPYETFRFDFFAV